MSFPPDSRYAGLPLRTRDRGDGTTVRYVSRRLVPRADERDATGLGEQRLAIVGPNDRPDLLAYRTLGNPLLAWALADANCVYESMEELTFEPGQTLVVPPAIVPGGG